jgi:hypothetical protein
MGNPLVESRRCTCQNKPPYALWKRNVEGHCTESTHGIRYNIDLLFTNASTRSSNQLDTVCRHSVINRIAQSVPGTIRDQYMAGNVIREQAEFTCLRDAAMNRHRRAGSFPTFDHAHLSAIAVVDPAAGALKSVEPTFCLSTSTSNYSSS